MKKIFSFLGLALLFASCDGDYTDWAQPNEEAQNPIAVEVSAAEAPSIQFGNNMDADIQIFVPTINAEEGATVNYLVALYDAARTNKVELEANAQGKVSTDELKAAIIQLYGKRPVEREVPVVVEYAIVNGKAMLTHAETYLYVSLDPNDVPVIENHYYYVGATNNWSDSDMTYELKNGGGDVYDDPIFTAVIPAPKDGDGNRVDNWFKIAPESAYTSGDFWNNLWGVAENGDASLTGNLAFGDIGAFCMPASDGAVAYKISIDMLGQTYEITPLTFSEYIYEAGVNNSWGNYQQPLYCPAMDGHYTGFFEAKEESWTDGKGAFKFRGAADNWDNGNYGAGENDDNGGSLIDDGNSGNIFVTPGFYRADVDLTTMTFTLTRIYSVFVVGSSVGNDWDNGVQMTFNSSEHCWECVTTLTEGVIKFKGNGTWDSQDGNWGGTLDNIINGSNDNIPVTTTGLVRIKFYPLCDTKSYATITPAS